MQSDGVRCTEQPGGNECPEEAELQWRAVISVRAAARWPRQRGALSRAHVAAVAHGANSRPARHDRGRGRSSTAAYAAMLPAGMGSGIFVTLAGLAAQPELSLTHGDRCGHLSTCGFAWRAELACVIELFPRAWLRVLLKLASPS